MDNIRMQRAFHILSPFIPFAILVLAAGYAPVAYADCVSSCLEDHGCEVEPESGRSYNFTTNCKNFQDDCEAQCQRESSSYGALAYDKKTNAWGMSDSMPDEAQAGASAIGFCAQHSPDCAVVETFNNDCGAIAQGENGVVTWAKNKTAEQAQSDALKSCAEKAGKPCQVQLSNCYFP